MFGVLFWSATAAQQITLRASDLNKSFSFFPID
jgi:hypothetical protein